VTSPVAACDGRREEIRQRGKQGGGRRRFRAPILDSFGEEIEGGEEDLRNSSEEL
jgi:hypothetical protein